MSIRRVSACMYTCSPTWGVTRFTNHLAVFPLPTVEGIVSRAIGAATSAVSVSRVSGQLSLRCSVW